MARKLPNGVSIKTIVEENNLVEMYRYQICKNGKVIDESILKYDDREEARNEGVKKFWKSKAGFTVAQLMIYMLIVIGVIGGVIITLTVKGCNYVKDKGVKNIAETVWNGSDDN